MVAPGCLQRHPVSREGNTAASKGALSPSVAISKQLNAAIQLTGQSARTFSRLLNISVYFVYMVWEIFQDTVFT